MPELFKPGLDAQVACVERELRLRRSVYPRQVSARRMSERKAEVEIEAMEEVLRTLQWCQRQGKAQRDG